MLADQITFLLEIVINLLDEFIDFTYQIFNKVVARSAPMKPEAEHCQTNILSILLSRFDHSHSSNYTSFLDVY